MGTDAQLGIDNAFGALKSGTSHTSSELTFGRSGAPRNQAAAATSPVYVGHGRADIHRPPTEHQTRPIQAETKPLHLAQKPKETSDLDKLNARAHKEEPIISELAGIVQTHYRQKILLTEPYHTDAFGMQSPEATPISPVPKEAVAGILETLANLYTSADVQTDTQGARTADVLHAIYGLISSPNQAGLRQRLTSLARERMGPLYKTPVKTHMETLQSQQRATEAQLTSLLNDTQPDNPSRAWYTAIDATSTIKNLDERQYLLKTLRFGGDILKILQNDPTIRKLVIKNVAPHTAAATATK